MNVCVMSRLVARPVMPGACRATSPRFAIANRPSPQTERGWKWLCVRISEPPSPFAEKGAGG